jgi:hypothetical protein
MNQTVKKSHSDSPSILNAAVKDGKITADISDGRVVSIPIAWFPKFKAATQEQLMRFEAKIRAVLQTGAPVLRS